MSLDFYLTATVPTTVLSVNITHNLGPMWRLAGVYDALYNSDGLTIASMLPTLQRGLDTMLAVPEVFKALNPENGWGDYEAALAFLKTVIDAAAKNPEGVISTWQ